MKRIRRLTLSLIILLLIIITLSCANSNRVYYRLHPIWTRDFIINQIADLNSDGNDEILITHPSDQNCQIDVMDWDLKTYYKSFRIDFDGKYEVYAFPAENIDSVNFLISYRKDNKIFYKLLPPTPYTVGKSVPGSMLKNFISFKEKDNKEPEKLENISKNKLKKFISYTKAKDTKDTDFHQSLGFYSYFTNSDNKKLALFSIQTGWDRNGKRGVVAADVKTGKVFWTFYFGSVIRQVIVRNFDKKRGDEIIISTYANNNGLFLNGTGDDSSYVFVLNSSGKLLWEKSIGPYWTGAGIQTGNFDHTGKKKMIVYLRLNRELDSGSRIMYLLDPLTGKILKEEQGNVVSASYSFSSNTCRDYNGDDIDEIVIGSMEGYVKMIDGSLKTTKQSKGFGRPINVVAAEDFDYDGRIEVVAYVKDKKIIVLDKDLNELCEYHFSERCNFSTLHANNKTYLVVSTVERDHSINQLFELQHSIFPFPTEQAKGNPYLWSLPFLAFAIAVVALYKNRKKKLFNFVAQFNTQLGSGDYTLIIDKNKKIKFIGRDWANILQIEHYSALGRDMNKILLPNTVKPVLEVVNELMDTKKRRKTVALRNKPEGFQNQYLVIMKFLRDLDFYAFAIIDKSDEEYIKKVRYWAVIAQDLAHGIKTVLASIDMDINNQCDLFQEKYNKDDADMLKYFNSIKGQLDRLKRMSDGFMRFVNFKKSELKPVDVNKKVSEILLNLHSSFSSFINIEWDLDKSNPKALIDERQFETALTNVFVNAVESIETEGTIRVCTRKVHAFSSSGKNNYEDGCVEIIIHDTGKGIAPVYLDKITQPYFTQKDSGTGLGLALVKRIIESHEGELRINSQPGIGTSVSMRFKSYNNGL